MVDKVQDEEFEYKAFQNKVDFVNKEDLPKLSLDEFKDYRFDLKCAISAIETDLEWKENTEATWRQKALSALKAYKIALLYADREYGRIGI